MAQNSSGAGAAESVGEVSGEAGGPELPNIELTGELLNDFLIADLALHRAQYDTAIEMYQRLALQTRDPRVADRATRVAMYANRLDIALKTGRLWLELDPANQEGRRVVTMLLIRDGAKEEAVGYLEQLLAEIDNDDERYLLLIRLLGNDQSSSDVVGIMRAFVERNPEDAAGLFALSQLAVRNGALDEAETAVDRLLQLRPRWPQAVILRTRILLATQRNDEALVYMESVVGDQSQNVDLLSAYGRMLLDAGRLEEGLAQLRQVLEIEPEDEETLYAAGIVAMRLEWVDEAAEFFERLSDLQRNADDANFFLGRIEEVRGDNKKAIKWYSKVSGGENYINSQVRRALLMGMDGEVEAARALLHTIKARHPGQLLRLYLAEGQILREVGRNQEAFEFYGRALEDIPDNTDLLYARAMVAEEVDRLDVVEQDLLSILEREPDNADALNSLGYTLADRTDRLEEAYNYIKRALELRPESFYILDSLGWVQFRMGMKEEALKNLRRALSIQHDPEIAAHLGEVLWALGSEQEARDIWQDALEQAPENDVLLEVIHRFGL